MNADWVKFLLAAVVVAVVCFAGIGAWLLPRLGVEGMAVNMICGAISGGIIAALYMKMIKKA